MKLIAQHLKKARLSPGGQKAWKGEYVPRLKNNIDPILTNFADKLDSYGEKLKKELKNSYQVSRYGIDQNDAKQLDQEVDKFIDSIYDAVDREFKKL